MQSLARVVSRSVHARPCRSITKTLVPVSLPTARISAPRAFLTARPFSSAIVLDESTPSKSIQLPDRPNPLALESERQLLTGNPAEAYGVHPDAGLFGKSGLIEKYGIYPTLSLFVAAAISKEWIILDEETLLLGTFATAFLIGYTGVKEPASKALDDAYNENFAKATQGFDEKLDALDQTRRELKSFLTIPEELAAFKAEVPALQKGVLNALNKNWEAGYVAHIEKALTDIENEERKYFGDIKLKMVDGAVQHAISAFRSGPQAAQLRKESVEAAVRALQTGKTSETDPVGKLFTDFTKKFEREVREKAAQSQASKLKERFAEKTKKRDEYAAQFELELANTKAEIPAELRLKPMSDAELDAALLQAQKQ